MAFAHFLIDTARSGLENMALDQSMLHQTDRDGEVRIRFYRWEQPTLSLGYFQRFSEFEQFQKQVSEQGTSGAELPLDLVRRSTGGGAIIHHFDWTYSIALPQRFEANSKSKGAACGLYFKVHQAVIDWIGQTFDRTLNSAELWQDKENCTTSRKNELTFRVGRENPGREFLCFQRRSSGDIVSGDNKLMGSAQRRFQSAILQHGSLLLSSSPHYPDLTGLHESLEIPRWDSQEESLHLASFAKSITEQLTECYQWELCRHEGCSTFVELDQVLLKRLESPNWTARI